MLYEVLSRTLTRWKLNEWRIGIIPDTTQSEEHHQRILFLLIRDATRDEHGNMTTSEEDLIHLGVDGAISGVVAA